MGTFCVIRIAKGVGDGVAPQDAITIDPVLYLVKRHNEHIGHSSVNLKYHITEQDQETIYST